MEIALHLGAHLTDDSQLRDCLLANSDMLAAQGIVVPRARAFQSLLNDAADHIASGHGAPGAFDRLLASVEAPDDTRRLVLSAQRLLSRLPDAMDGTRFYPGAKRRLAALRHIFAGQEVEIFLAIRNPASFVPAYLGTGRAQAQGEVDAHASGTDLRWSQLIEEIRTVWPEARLTLWCDEDTPFIWHRVLRLVAGHSPAQEFEHSFNWFDTVLVEGASQKLAAYLEASPPIDEAHRQKVIAVFLDKFCDDQKLDIDVSVTGWDDAHVDLLTELYEADTARIAAMDGVTLIQP
ncbi:MAG: hypothetical protein JJU07_06480 [Natronohydrobacter sp.]|nr:hypothetical protein [Natronohydrobacter sp.]